MVWIVVGVAVVLALVVLGVVVFLVLGASARLGRELEAVESEVRPLVEQAQATVARAAERGANRG